MGANCENFHACDAIAVTLEHATAVRQGEFLKEASKMDWMTIFNYGGDLIGLLCAFLAGLFTFIAKSRFKKDPEKSQEQTQEVNEAAPAAKEVSEMKIETGYDVSFFANIENGAAVVNCTVNDKNTGATMTGAAAAAKLREIADAVAKKGA